MVPANGREPPVVQRMITAPKPVVYIMEGYGMEHHAQNKHKKHPVPQREINGIPIIIIVVPVQQKGMIVVPPMDIKRGPADAAPTEQIQMSIAVHWCLVLANGMEKTVYHGD